MPKISLIIPAYNEEKRIRKTIKRAKSILFKLGIKDFEIIVVDDGSTDKTSEEAKKENVIVVGYKKNKGKGYAIKYGSKFASKDLITFLDADSEIDPKQMKILLDYMERYKADFVIGSKRHKLSKIEYYPLIRKILSISYNILVRLLFHFNVKDTQAGIKLIKAKALKKILPFMRVKRFAFDVELIAYAKKFNFKVVEAPIILKFSKKGIGRIKLKTILNIFFDTMAIAYRFYILQFYSSILKNVLIFLSIFLVSIFVYKNFFNPYIFPFAELKTIVILFFIIVLISVLGLPYEYFSKRFD
jgi:glycosyltransferase involved in cell wall biosynthesis